MNPTPPPEVPFEDSINNLERILRSLEDGTTSLEEGLAQYERGVSLLKGCYEQLRTAEQKILLLTGVDADGKPQITPFDHAATAEMGRPLDARRTAPKPKLAENGNSGSY